MTNKMKRLIAHLIAIIVAIVCPVWAICAKFPIWSSTYSTGQTVGIGLIMIIFVTLVTCRKMIFSKIKEWLGVHTMPPVVMWAILLLLAMGMNSLSKFLGDFETVCFAGLIGSGIGCIIDAVSNMLWKESPLGESVE